MGRAISASYSQDLGRILENIVFLFLRRAYKDIFYYRDERECDFLIKEREKITQAIQVCSILTAENKEREVEGLRAALKKFKLKQGIIVTLDQDDHFGEDVKVIPAWKWMTH